MNRKTGKRKSHAYNKLCLVCGDYAKRFWYGAIVCGACKTFFESWDGLLNADSQKHCKNKQMCILTPKTRRLCKYCRFQKCHLLGMPNRKKSIEVVKRLEDHTENLIRSSKQSFPFSQGKAVFLLGKKRHLNENDPNNYKKRRTVLVNSVLDGHGDITKSSSPSELFITTPSTHPHREISPSCKDSKSGSDPLYNFSMKDSHPTDNSVFYNGAFWIVDEFLEIFDEGGLSPDDVSSYFRALRRESVATWLVP